MIPVGGETQQLQLVVNSAEGLLSEAVESVRFVPMRSGTVRSLTIPEFSCAA